MKKYLWVIVSLFLLTACTRNIKTIEEEMKEKTFFGSLPAPKVKFDKISQDFKDGNKEQYTAIINNYSYQDFYEYIMTLEDNGYHYEFLEEYVPKKQEKLPNPEETAWMAIKGDVHVIINWCSDDNSFYQGYNLQIIFSNY